MSGDKDNELVTKLKEVFNQRKAIPNQVTKPDVLLVSAEKIDPARKQMLIVILKEIKSKASKGNATSNDIQIANEIAAELGGPFENAGKEVESINEQAIVSQRARDIAGDSSVPVTSATEYFERKEIKQIDNTLSSIEAGEPVKTEELIETVKNLTSDKERELRKKTLEDLEEEKKRLFKEAIIKKESITEYDQLRIQEIDKQLAKLYRNDASDDIITAKIGNHENVKDLTEATLRHEAAIKNDLKEYLLDGAKKTVHTIENSTKNLYQHTAAAIRTEGASVTQSALAAVDKTMNAVKEEIIQERATLAVTVTAQKVAATEEKIADGSSLGTIIDNKISKEEAWRAARAAKKAAKAKAPVIEYADSSVHLSPDHAPPMLKPSIKLDGPGSLKKTDGHSR